jgi:hypothetical protein
MAINFSCSSCGKRFSVSEDRAGRRTKCSACGWGLTVPMESEWAPDDDPPARPAFKPPPIPIGADPLSGRKSALRPWLIALAIGVAGSVVAWLVIARIARGRRLEAERLAFEADARRIATSPTPGDIATWAEAVKLLVDRDVQSRFRDSKTVESAKISSITVRLAPADNRKVPWLWVENATIAIRFRRQPDGAGDFGATYLWKSLMQCVPGGPVGECWRDVTDPGDGTKTHHHYALSEWTSDFRAKLTAEWLAFFERLEKNTRNREGFSDYERKKLLQAEKSRLARAFKVSEEEVEEILKATD